MFIKTQLTDVICVKSIVTLHCFDYNRNFRFTGDTHDFWELVYVDSGEVGVLSDTYHYILHSKEAIFHKPGDYHNIWANDTFASVIIITFDSDSEAVQFFSNKVFIFSASQKEYLSKILCEGISAFEGPLDIIDQTQLLKRKDAPFGSEQMIKTLLEQLLIDLIRTETASAAANTRPSAKSDSGKNDKLVSDIMQMLRENVCGHIELEEISEHLNFSKSYIKTRFKSTTGTSIYQTYIKMKINHSKRLLSEDQHSITEISEILGFNSVHYFSRAFKNSTGMTPSAYHQSVRKRALL